MKEVFVARDSEIAEGGRKVVIAEDTEIGVFRVGGALYAWKNQCPHQGGPICQGRLIKGVEERLDDEKRSLGIHYKDDSLHVVCPWHGYEFDVKTGRHAGIASVRLASFPVKLKDGDIYVVLRS